MSALNLSVDGGVAAASIGVPLAEAFALEDEAVRKIMRSQDAKEGARAFAQHRRPQFTGT
jgi:enoyl-CoA hydratase/carnithine racemase